MMYSKCLFTLIAHSTQIETAVVVHITSNWFHNLMYFQPGNFIPFLLSEQSYAESVCVDSIACTVNDIWHVMCSGS